MFFKLDDGSFLNLARVFRVAFDEPNTKLYFSQMAHDFVTLRGDHVADVLAAARGESIKGKR